MMSAAFSYEEQRRRVLGSVMAYVPIHGIAPEAVADGALRKVAR